MAVRRMGTFGLGTHLHERKRLVLEGIGRTRRSRYGQGGNGNVQNSEPEVEGIKPITFPLRSTYCEKLL
jgi:hypothetical protein